MDDGEWRNPASLWKPRRSKCHQGSKEEWRGGRDALKEASFQQPSVGLRTCFSGPQCASHELQWPSGPGQQTSSFPTSKVESPSVGATRRVLLPIPGWDWSNDAGPSQSRPPTFNTVIPFSLRATSRFPKSTLPNRWTAHLHDAPGLGYNAMDGGRMPSPNCRGTKAKRVLRGTSEQAINYWDGPKGASHVRKGHKVSLTVQ